MSIQKKREAAARAAGVGGRNAELQLFVDRHRYVREFASALHQLPPDEQVLFFYGVGGVGKSLLLRYLRDQASKIVPPDVWRGLDALGDSEFRTSFESSTGIPVPVALHDFSSHVVGEEDPCDHFYGPLMLRAQLGRLGFRFPRFDFAVVLFAQRKGFSSERVAALLPSADPGTTTDLLDFLVENTKAGAVASFVVNRLFERYGDSVAVTVAKHRAPEEQVAEIYRLEIETELVPLLPRYLAEDLVDGLDRRREKGQLGRVCLFFDTHDAFWAEQSFGGSEDQRNARDRWFRTLLLNLDLDKALVVVTGRERPRWAAAKTDPVDAEYVHEVAVGDLDREDARLYLEQRGVANSGTQDKILDALRTETGVHPLSLGLAADLVKVSTTGVGDDLADVLDGTSLDFGHIGPKLLERLLSYLPAEECQAITALGACRTFDRELYLLLGRELAFTHSGAAFAHIKRLSFVIPYLEGDGRESFKIHTLLRKSVIESEGELVQQTHAVLARHYGALSRTPGDAPHLEQLFHTSRLVGQRDAAVADWLTTMDLARDAADTQMLLRLLGLEDELVLERWHERAGLALARAALYGVQGRSDDAEQALTEALAAAPARPADDDTRLLVAELLLQLGWVERYRTRSAEATAAFERALDLVRERRPALDHMRGRLCFGLSGVPSDAGDAEASTELLVRASVAYEQGREALGEQTPVRWVSDASFTETCLSGNLRRAGRPVEAAQRSAHGVELAERASAMAPDDHRNLLNLESAYAEQAMNLTDDLRAAEEAATRSVETCRRLTTPQQPAGERLVSRLLMRAALQIALGRRATGAADVTEAVEVAQRTVDVRPRHRGSHLHLAKALLAQSRLADADAATRMRAAALDAVQEALRIAPAWVEAKLLAEEVLATPA